MVHDVEVVISINYSTVDSAIDVENVDKVTIQAIYKDDDVVAFDANVLMSYWLSFDSY